MEDGEEIWRLQGIWMMGAIGLLSDSDLLFKEFMLYFPAL